MSYACGLKIRGSVADIVLGAELSDILGIHPAELGFVEDSRGFAESLYTESLGQLVHGKELAVVSGAPADECNIVDYCLCKIALCKQVLKARISVTLAQLACCVLHDRGQMNVDGLLPTKGFVEKVVLRRGAKVLVSPHYMGYAHGVVVDDVCEVVGGHSVGLDEHAVVQLGAVNIDPAVDHIVKASLTALRNVLANDIAFACGKPCFNFLPGQVQTVLIVLKGLASRLDLGTAGVQLLLGAEAIIGMSALDQLFGVGEIHILALTLNIGAVIASDIRAFIPVEACKLQPGINLFDSAFYIARLIGILDTENEGSVVLLGKQVGIQRRSESADM